MLPGFLPQLSCPVVMIHSPGFGIPGVAQLFAVIMDDVIVVKISGTDIMILISGAVEL